VATLAEWAKGDDRWTERPAGVVVIGSHSTPQLVASLGDRIAAVGRLPLLGTVTPSTSADAASRTNSAQRVRALHDAFRVPEELAAALSSAGGPVLLVDDLVDSGWTMAIVARLLRRSGARAILPFALALSA